MAQPHTAFYRGATSADKINWFRRADLPGDNIFEGLVTATEFREGLGVHTLNARARHSFETKTERVPGVILNCFLEGTTEAWLDGKPMELGRLGHAPVTFSLSAIDEPLSFQRRSAPGEYVRKVSIQMSHAWLHQQSLKIQKRLNYLGKISIVQTGKPRQKTFKSSNSLPQWESCKHPSPAFKAKPWFWN